MVAVAGHRLGNRFLWPFSAGAEGLFSSSVRSPYNIVDAAPHQAGGSLTCRRATNAPRRSAYRDTGLVHSRTTTQGSKPCLITHSRANLALILTKLVLRTKDLIFMLLDGLEVFLDVCVMSWNSSNLQMAREHIYIYASSRTSRL